MKKLFGSLIALICVVACVLLLPIEADAATSGYYTYWVSNGKAFISEVDTAISGDITIPSVLGGYPVTGISSEAFKNCTGLTSVTIPDGVTSIGSKAFYGCRSLTSVIIPDSVTDMSFGAFYGCTSLTSVPIPSSVTGIGDRSFYGCTSLTSVTIPDSVTWIGGRAFESCTSLTSVTIGNSVTTIGNYAFSDCSSLTSVTIPDGVTSIGSKAFYGCRSLTSVTIPNSVTNIGEDAFASCVRLQYSLYDNAKYLGNDANPYYALIRPTSTSIASCQIHSDTVGLSAYAFEDCTSLTSVTIPNSVTNIGESAFDGCTSLTSANIPDSVTNIGVDAFAACWGLNAVHISDISTWCSISFGNSFSNPLGYAKNLYLNGNLVTDLVIPDGVTKIEDSAFCGCTSLTSVIISDSVTTIGDSAFKGCTGLTAVIIGDGVTGIGSYAFACSFANGASVTIGNSVTSIGYRAFYFGGPTSVIIPDSITYIGDEAFAVCDDLTSVTYCGTEEQWNAISIGLSNKALTNAERNYHNWQDATCTEPKTCILCGETTGEAIGHIWYATCTEPRTCTVCGGTDGEALGHSYVAEILEKPTFTTTGQQQKVCSVCGDTVTETLDMLVGEVSGWNVTLCDDLQVNFHLHISQSIENTARVRIVVGEEGYTFRVSGLEKTEDGLYIASVNIAAAQMTDFIFVTVINGSDLAKTASYTVRGYADTILADEDHSQYHQLVREMLNYGAAAQVYFDYEKDNLASEGIADAGSVEIPDSVDSELSVTGNAEGVTFYGASLIFRNKITVRYYFQFKGDINDCSFTVNDTTYALQLKDGLYYVEIADILPQNLGEEITLMVTDAEGNSLKVCYNPMNYIVRMNEKGSAALQNLVKALYNYHLAAKALQETV